MPMTSRTILMASMDVEPEYEDLFNEVYDREHVPYLMQVPGVRSVTRWKGVPFEFALGGEIRQMPAPQPRYTAIYELDGPQVLASREWAEAVERGRWASEVRPHTRNRSHAVFERHDPA